MYYYTDYNTFKLILTNGTLRFKESTASNDRLDTIQLYNELITMAEDKLKDANLKAEQKFYFDMLRHNGVKSSRVSLVACFSTKADSRMLWDAYTMHRKDRVAERYNGVCIEFDKQRLIHSMKRFAEIFDVKDCRSITYGFEGIKDYLEQIMNAFSEDVERLAKEKDQKQDIIPPIQIPLINKALELKKCIVVPLLKLIDKFDTSAPFIKHSFWEEECEIRALLSMKRANVNIQKLGQYEDKSYYFDLPINDNCIKRVILGPEFMDEEIEKLRALNGSISFDGIQIEKSIGTNIITNR